MTSKKKPTEVLQHPAGQTVKSASPSTDADITRADATTPSTGYTEDDATPFYLQAQQWINDCQQAYVSASDEMCNAMNAGRKVSHQRAFQNMRGKFVDRYGKPVKLNNDLGSFIARIWLADHPQARPLMDLRESRADAIRSYRGAVSLLGEPWRSRYLRGMKRRG